MLNDDSKPKFILAEVAVNSSLLDRTLAKHPEYDYLMRLQKEFMEILTGKISKKDRRCILCFRDMELKLRQESAYLLGRGDGLEEAANQLKKYSKMLYSKE